MSSAFRGTRGVRTIHGAMRSRAARISSSDGARIEPDGSRAGIAASSQLYPHPGPTVDGPLVDRPRGRQVLDRQANAAEDGDLVTGLSSRRHPCQDLADLTDDVILADGALGLSLDELTGFV